MTAIELPDAGAVTRGVAQRFFYAGAAGRLERIAGARSDDPFASGGWRAVPFGEVAQQIVWDRDSGEDVLRPRSRRDRVCSVLVAREDRNAAWMAANRIDPEALFEIEEPFRETRATSAPIWPIGEPIA